MLVLVLLLLQEGGHLGELLVDPAHDFDARKGWVLDLAAAVQYLHSQNIVHRDIKPQNVLVASDGRCLLTDFGIARSLTLQNSMTSQIGTVAYMAPEAIDESTFEEPAEDIESPRSRRMSRSPSRKRRSRAQTQQMYAPALDTYSFGVLLAAVFNEQEPFEGLSPTVIIAQVLTGTLRPEVPTVLTDEAAAFLRLMWHADPRKRPWFPEIAARLDDLLVERDETDPVGDADSGEL